MKGCSAKNRNRDTVELLGSEHHSSVMHVRQWSRNSIIARSMARLTCDIECLMSTCSLLNSVGAS